MADRRLALVVMVAALVAGCAVDQRLESSGGIALRIDDDVDALEDAMDRADDHCDAHGRVAVLQSVSRVGGGDRLATFNCVDGRGRGVAVFVDEDDDDLRDAMREAEAYCEDFDRIAVLQSVGEIDDRRIATFACATS